MRPFASALVSILLAATASAAIAAEPKPGGAINVATVGEPPTLDPMESPADVVGIISQHIFETLYTWGDGWKVVPLLAASDAEVSADGTTYTIPLRTGVKFHDGSDMTSEDVKASLERWMRVAQRGKQTAEKVASLEAPDANTIRIVLKEPFAPLLPLLSLQTSAAIILPAEKQAQPMTEFVGTGPYQFKERQPDQYVQLVRFDGYVARDDAANMYGGRRVAYLDEIRFVPVPNASTRIEGALSGLYHYADALPVESLPRLEGQAQVEPIVLKPFGWPLMFFNAKPGALTDPALRRAVVASLNFEDMLAAAFGSTDFYEAEGGLVSGGLRVPQRGGAEIYGRAATRRRRRRWPPRQAMPASRSGSWSASSTTSTSRWRRWRPSTCAPRVSPSICRCSTGRRCSSAATMRACGRSSSPTARSCPSRPSTRS